MNNPTAAAAIATANSQLCDVLEGLPKDTLPSDIEAALTSLFENLGLALIPPRLHIMAAAWHISSAQEDSEIAGATP